MKFALYFGNRGFMPAELIAGARRDMIKAVEDAGLTGKSVEEIFDFYFSHLNAEGYAPEEIFLRCNCSDEKIESTLRSLGKKECDEILKEMGKIEVVCHFCEKRYVYGQEEVDKLWQ